MKSKGQVSVEIIILVGMLIIGAIVLSIALINSYNKNITQSQNISDKQGSVVEGFIKDYNSISSSSGNNTITETFTYSLVSPIQGPPSYSPEEGVSFKIVYQNNQGPVTCSWNVNNIQFNGCDTSRNFDVGDYTFTYTLVHLSRSYTGSGSFRVNYS